MHDQHFKRGGDVKKRKDQISRRIILFLCYQSIPILRFVAVIPVSPHTTLNEMPRIKLMTALLF